MAANIPGHQQAANNFRELIRQLDLVFGAAEPDMHAVLLLLSAYPNNHSDWNMLYQELTGQDYALVLIHGTNRYNLALSVRLPDQATLAHDHSGNQVRSHAFAKVLQGRLLEKRFSQREDGRPGLHKTGEFMLERDSVSYMSERQVIHQMIPMSQNEATVLLHVDTPPYDWYRTYNVDTGETADKTVIWLRRRTGPEG